MPQERLHATQWGLGILHFCWVPRFSTVRPMKIKCTAPRQRLAARQERLLEQLMTANSRSDKELTMCLIHSSAKKLDSFKGTSEVTVGRGTRDW
jgi:hypothetical protein